jgi:hypothetical protein
MPLPAGYAAKYHTAFTGEDGYDYRLRFAKDGYGGASSLLYEAGPGHTAAVWEGDAERAEDIRFFAADLTASVQDTAAAALAAEVRAAGERGFCALLERDEDGNGSYETECLVAWVKPGYAERSRSRFGGVTTLAAFCGLSELAGRTYQETHGYALSDTVQDVRDGLRAMPRESLIAGITRCLTATGFALPVRVAQNWGWQGTTAPTPGRGLEHVEYHPFAYAPSLDGDMWYCDAALADMLSQHLLRVYQWLGVWWVVQYDYPEDDVRAGTDLTYYEYDADFHDTGAAPSSGTYTPGMEMPTGAALYLARDDSGGGQAADPVRTASIVQDHGRASGDLIDNPGFEGTYTGGIAPGWAFAGSGTETGSAAAPLGGEGVFAQYLTAVENTTSSYWDRASAYTLARGIFGNWIEATGSGAIFGGQLGFSVKARSHGDRDRWIFVEVMIDDGGTVYYLAPSGTWTTTQSALGDRIPGGALVDIGATGIGVPPSGIPSVRIYAPVEAYPGTPVAGAGASFDDIEFTYTVAGESEPEATFVTAESDADAGTEREAISLRIGDEQPVITPVSLTTPAGDLMPDWQRGADTPVGSLGRLITGTLVDLRRTSRDHVEETYYARPGGPAPIAPLHYPVIEDESGTPVPYALHRLEWGVDTGTSRIEAHELYRETGTTTYSNRSAKATGGTSGGVSGDYSGGRTTVFEPYDHLRSDGWDGTIDGNGNITAFATAAGFALTGEGHVDIFDGANHIRINASEQQVKFAAVTLDGTDGLSIEPSTAFAVERALTFTDVAQIYAIDPAVGDEKLIVVSDEVITLQTGASHRVELSTPEVRAGNPLEVIYNASGLRTAQQVRAGAPVAAGAAGDVVAANDVIAEGDATVSGAATIGGTLDHNGASAGFFGAAPTAQPAGAAQAAVVLGNTNNEIGGLAIGAVYTQAEVQALRDKAEELADDVRNLSDLVHAMRTALVSLGLIKGSA